MNDSQCISIGSRRDFGLTPTVVEVSERADDEDTVDTCDLATYLPKGTVVNHQQLHDAFMHQTETDDAGKAPPAQLQQRLTAFVQDPAAFLRANSPKAIAPAMPIAKDTEPAVGDAKAALIVGGTVPEFLRSSLAPQGRTAIFYLYHPSLDNTPDMFAAMRSMANTLAADQGKVLLLFDLERGTNDYTRLMNEEQQRLAFAIHRKLPLNVSLVPVREGRSEYGFSQEHVMLTDSYGIIQSVDNIPVSEPRAVNKIGASDVFAQLRNDCAVLYFDSAYWGTYQAENIRRARRALAVATERDAKFTEFVRDDFNDPWLSDLLPPRSNAPEKPSIIPDEVFGGLIHASLEDKQFSLLFLDRGAQIFAKVELEGAEFDGDGNLLPRRTAEIDAQFESALQLFKQRCPKQTP